MTAIIQYGDPRFILDQPYDIGDADHDGVSKTFAQDLKGSCGYGLILIPTASSFPASFQDSRAIIMPIVSSHTVMMATHSVNRA